jgi:signal transduction histidine kinase
MTAQDEHLAARRILSVTEEELQRIILDIHDGPVQKLFVALSQLSTLETRMAARGDSPEEWRAALGRIASLIEASLGEIRASLGTWRPPGFARRDLVSMLEGLIIQHEEFTDCRVEWEVVGVPPPLALPAKIAVYRILQEALSNVYRHSGVKNVWVRLAAQPDRVRLEVMDKGRGFDPPPLVGPLATERAEHIGLRGMRERVALVGGTLTLVSAPGQGTRIVVEVPANE